MPANIRDLFPSSISVHFCVKYGSNLLQAWENLAYKLEITPYTG